MAQDGSGGTAQPPRQVKGWEFAPLPDDTAGAAPGVLEPELVTGATGIVAAIATIGTLVTRSALIQAPLASSNQSPALVRATTSSAAPVRTLPTTA